MPEGIFKCGPHEFATDSIEDWQEHQATESHTHIGRAPCNQCGIPSEFTFTGKVGLKVPALCSDCKTMLLGGSQ
jgi:hypothetical protein